MKVFKVRNIDTGEFVRRNRFNSSSKTGRVYSNIGHIKTSFGEGDKSRWDLSRYEVVELELQEVKSTPLTDIL